MSNSPLQQSPDYLGSGADLSWLEPGFAIGSRPYEHQREAIRQAGVDVVVSLVSLVPEEEQAWLALSVEALSFPTHDWIGIPPRQFDVLVRTILDQRAQGKSVLVHCFAGVNRAPTIAAAVLAWRDHLNVGDAVNRVRAARPTAAPTPQQLASLQEWLDQARRRSHL